MRVVDGSECQRLAHGSRVCGFAEGPVRGWSRDFLDRPISRGVFRCFSRLRFSGGRTLFKWRMDTIGWRCIVRLCSNRLYPRRTKNSMQVGMTCRARFNVIPANAGSPAVAEAHRGKRLNEITSPERRLDSRVRGNDAIAAAFQSCRRSFAGPLARLAKPLWAAALVALLAGCTVDKPDDAYQPRAKATPTDSLSGNYLAGRQPWPNGASRRRPIRRWRA